MDFNRLKGLQYIVSCINIFNQLNYFSIDWFHLSQMKSINYTKNSTYRFHLNHIIYVVLSRAKVWLWVLELENLSFIIEKLYLFLCNTQLQRIDRRSWRHFGLRLAWRTHVWLARESHHQVWLFLCLWLFA